MYNISFIVILFLFSSFFIACLFPFVSLWADWVAQMKAELTDCNKKWRGNFSNKKKVQKQKKEKQQRTNKSNKSTNRHRTSHIFVCSTVDCGDRNYSIFQWTCTFCCCWSTGYQTLLWERVFHFSLFLVLFIFC